MIKILCDECLKEMDVTKEPKITLRFTNESKAAEFHFCCLECSKKYTSSLKEEVK